MTGAKGGNGEVKATIDFDLLRQELSGNVIEGSSERYRLDWPGKRDALRISNSPISKTFRPDRSDSVNFEDTENLYIEGDNLEALKLIQENYLGRIKMIYIDPPYNRGSDLIYSDVFTKTPGDYLIDSGQLDSEGTRLVGNLDTSGRYHSDWLSMMYSRLKIARNLLAENGVVFISLNDIEISSLRKICDEVFGEKSFLAQFIWNTEGNTDNQFQIKVNHEYILCYVKNEEFKDEAIGRVIDPNTPEGSNLLKGYADNNINKNNPENPPCIVTLPKGFPCSEDSLFYKAKKVDEKFFTITKGDKFISDEIKGEYGIENNSGLPIKLDDMEVINGLLVKSCRIYGGMANRAKLEQFIANSCKEIDDDGAALHFYINSNAAVRYRKANEKPRNILSVLRNFGTTEKSKTYLKSLGLSYDYPKPVQLIEYLIKIGCENEGVVLDFFSGSSTTAEAALRVSTESCIKRKYIMVQYPEVISPDKKEQKFAFDFLTKNDLAPNLCEIGKERIRRVSANLKEGLEALIDGELPGSEKHSELTEKLANLDTGFRVLKVDSSNMADVYYQPDQVGQQDLFEHIDNIKPDRTHEDLLFQVLLDWGLELSLPIDSQTINDQSVFFVDGNALAACFETKIGEDLVREVAKRKPLRVVFRDSGFADDSTKINVVQIFKQLSPETEVRSI